MASHPHTPSKLAPRAFAYQIRAKKLTRALIATPASTRGFVPQRRSVSEQARQAWSNDGKNERRFVAE
jgi:hypothetical protein